MRIFVTGATGFLGEVLCKHLTAGAHEVTAVGSRQADLTDDRALLAYRETRYDQIYHLAAWTQAGDFCTYHAGEQWIINQQLNTNVIAWWQKYQAGAKLITMGTSVSYASEQDLRESQYMLGLPSEKFYAYAMSKRMLHAGVQSVHKQFGLRYLTLVPSMLYGPGYHLDGREMHFIYDLIRKILRGKLYGEPVVLWGDGTQRRELVYVEDFVRIATQLAESHDNDIVNVGAGEEFSIRQFAQMICEQVGYDFDSIQFDTTCYVGAKSKCLDVSRLKSLLPDLALTPLHSGLAGTIQWFWEHQQVLLPRDT